MIDELETIKSEDVARDIARNGTEDDRAAFVRWCCDAIAYHSGQYGDDARERCAIVERQYHAYLLELDKRKR